MAFFLNTRSNNWVVYKLTSWPVSSLSLSLHSSVTNTLPQKRKATRHRARRTLRHAICTLWGRAPGQLGWDSAMDGSLCHQLAGGATKRLNAWLSPESTLIMSEHINCERSVAPVQKTEPCIKMCPYSCPLNSHWGSKTFCCFTLSASLTLSSLAGVSHLILYLRLQHAIIWHYLLPQVVQFKVNCLMHLAWGPR